MITIWNLELLLCIFSRIMNNTWWYRFCPTFWMIFVSVPFFLLHFDLVFLINQKTPWWPWQYLKTATSYLLRNLTCVANQITSFPRSTYFIFKSFCWDQTYNRIFSCISSCMCFFVFNLIHLFLYLQIKAVG